VSVFLGSAKPRGTFHFDRDYPVGAYPTAIAAADLNADGALDLAVGNHDDPSLSILLNFGCLRRVCRAAKLKTASRLAGTLLDCHARAKGRDLPVDAACLSRAQAAVAETFAGAEAKGECNTTGNASAVGAALEGLAAAVSQELPGSPGDANANRCAAAKLKAAGKRAKGALGCEARAAKGDDPVDADCVAGAADKFTQAFASAEAKGGCATTGDAGSVAAGIDARLLSVVAQL